MRTGTPRRRVRWTLLVLLWIWAGSVFATLDLFKNVPEFDRVRPDARWYRGARYVAHEMVGEPYLEGDEFGEAGAAGEKPVAPTTRTVAAPVERTFGTAARLRVVAGAPAHEDTAARLAERIRAFAAMTNDPAKRAAAERALARLETRTGAQR